jgi:magnesium transporter
MAAKIPWTIPRVPCALMLGAMAAATEREIAILVRHSGGGVRTLPSERIGEISDLTSVPGTLVWVSAVAPSDEDIVTFGREFGLHDLALEDLRKREQRPKVDQYEGHQMVVAYEAVRGADRGVAEIHIQVGAGWLLSVHWTPTPMLEATRRRFEQRDGDIASPGALLHALLDAAVDGYFPELDGISDRIEILEDRVLEGEADPESLREILHLKRRLLELRRVLAPMRDVANSLLRRDVDLVEPATMPYYQDLYDHLVRVLDQLDVYRDLLAAVLDARLSVVSNNLNAIMKRLTALTVVLMVPTLIAGIYGMNFVHMPELGWVLGYPFAMALMGLAMAAAVLFFWRRGWF